MTKVDEILLLLRKRTPLKEIHRKYKSQSQFYKAMCLFEPEADEDIERRQRQLSSLSTKIIDLQEQNKSLTSTHNQLIVWNTKAAKAKVQLQLEVENLRKVIEENRGELDGITHQLGELTRRGITPNFLIRVLDVESAFGEKFLERVRTVKDHLQLQNEVTTLNKQKTRVEEDILDLNKTSNKIQTMIQTQRNILDEAELKTRIFKEAINATISFFSGGYNAADLLNLKTGLDILAVKGDSALSIKRLVTGLEDVKTLTNLKAQIEEKEKECNTLNANINIAKGELNALQGTVLKTLKEAKVQAIEEIKSVSMPTISEIQKMWRISEENLKKFISEYITQIETLNERAMKSFNYADTTAEGIVTTLDTHIERAMNVLKDSIFDITQQFIKDMKEYDDLKDQIRDQEILGKYSVHLLAVIKSSPKEITNIPLEIIAQLMERIYWYTYLKFPDVKATPSDAVCQLSEIPTMYGKTLYTTAEYKLCALALFLKEEFEKKVWEEAKK